MVWRQSLSGHVQMSSKDQNDLFKGSIWNDFFRNKFGRNLDMVPEGLFEALSVLIDFILKMVFWFVFVANLLCFQVPFTEFWIFASFTPNLGIRLRWEWHFWTSFWQFFTKMVPKTWNRRILVTPSYFKLV